MATITRSKPKTSKKRTLPKTKFEFIGRAWKNIAKKTGEPYVSIKLDNDVQKIQLINDQDVRILLFKNKKREGKKDADYRLVLAMPDKDSEDSNEEEIDF